MFVINIDFNFCWIHSYMLKFPIWTGGSRYHVLKKAISRHRQISSRERQIWRFRMCLPDKNPDLWCFENFVCGSHIIDPSWREDRKNAWYKSKLYKHETLFYFIFLIYMNPNFNKRFYGPGKLKVRRTIKEILLKYSYYKSKIPYVWDIHVTTFHYH